MAATVRAGAAVATGDLDVVLPLAGTTANRSALTALAATTLRPGQSADTRRAAEARLAPPPSQRAQVVAWARSKGLTASGDAWEVRLEGPAATVAQAFAVHLVHRSVRSGTGAVVETVSPTTTPAVPAALRGAITSVLGLDNAPILMTHHSAVSIGQVHAAYGQSVRPAMGGGITVATLQLSGWDAADASTYASQLAIPGQQQLTQVAVDGADPAQVDGAGGDQEVALDVEAILGQAPSAHQRIYFADLSVNNGDGTFSPDASDVLDAYDALATDAEAGLVQVASTSWGGCEPDLGAQFSAQLQTEVTRIVAAGATFFAASGDSGTQDCDPQGPNSGVPSVDVPASIPQTVAVGGTTLTASGGQFSETSWDHGGSASGGGTSTLFTDSYQTGSTAARRVPDISSDADPDTGIAIVVDDSAGHPEDAQFGGTSLAAPTMAAQLADALSASGASAGIGDIHAALYAASTSATRGAAAITDITASGVGSAGYPATAGYDMSTGLGTPYWSLLAPALGLTLSSGSTYHPLTPVRVLDTRTGNGAAEAKVGPRATITLTIPAGLTGGASTESAVVLNVTAVGVSAPSYVSVFPAGDLTGSSTSVLNIVPGVSFANLVTTQVHNGQVQLYNNNGSTDLVADLEGYYTADTTGDGYHPLTPARLLDTRKGSGALGQGATRTLLVAGAGGAPSNAAAVVLTVTSVSATSPTYLSVYPTGTSGGSSSSSLDPPAGVPTANQVIVPVGTNGTISIYNFIGSTQVLVDLAGYYSQPSSGLSGLAFFAQNPYRVLDTRRNAGAAMRVSATGIVQGLTVAGLGMGAVATNVTAVAPTSYAYVAVFPLGTTPTTSQLQVRKGVNEPAAVQASLPTSGPNAGLLKIVVNAGSAPIAVDVFGYFAALISG